MFYHNRQRKLRSGSKQQQFVYQQPTYLAQYVQQPYMEAVAEAFNQPQVPAYQHAQAVSTYQPAHVAPAY